MRTDESPVPDLVVARMASSSASWVGGEGSEEMRRDWCRRARARSGCEDGVRPAEVRIGIRFVVSCCALAGST